MKRYFSLLLALLLLLPGCGNKSPEEDCTAGQAAETVARAMLSSLEENREANALIWYLEPGDMDDYVTDLYKLEELNWLDGAIVRMEGDRAFELAVLFLDEWDVEGTVEALQAYLLDRKTAFAGCLPDQAELIDRALILTRTQCVALIVCENPDAAQEAFDSCLEGE